MRHVGNTENEIIEPRLNPLELLFECLQLLCLRIHLRHQFRRILAFALRLADLLGERVAPRLQLLGVDLNLLALRFERAN